VKLEIKRNKNEKKISFDKKKRKVRRNRKKIDEKGKSSTTKYKFDKCRLASYSAILLAKDLNFSFFLYCRSRWGVHTSGDALKVTQPLLPRCLGEYNLPDI
jgi:hypothetical protein